MWFEPQAGFCIWRDQRDSEEFAAGIPELSDHFDALGIPYLVRVEFRTAQGRRTPGFTLVVGWDDLSVLTKWVPSFSVQVENAKAELAGN